VARTKLVRILSSQHSLGARAARIIPCDINKLVQTGFDHLLIGQMYALLGGVGSPEAKKLMADIKKEVEARLFG